MTKIRIIILIFKNNLIELNKAQVITEFGSGRVQKDIDVKVENMRNLISQVHRLKNIYDFYFAIDFEVNSDFTK
jgi:hypothetical protein